jgi:excisionase family DNA binding protein
MAATMKVEEAGKELGISRNAAYQAARAGEIPTIRIGRRLLVPRVAFERMLESAGQTPREPKTD